MPKVTEMNGGGEDMLRLPAVLDLAASEDFLGTVHQHLQRHPSLCLDASAVETLTLPCVQIILAGIATQRVSVINPSEAFASAFRDMALDWGSNAEGESRIEPAAPVTAETASAPVIEVALDPVETVPEAVAPMPEAALATEPMPEPVAVMAEPMPEIAPAPVDQAAPAMAAIASEPVPELEPALAGEPEAPLMAAPASVLPPEVVSAPDLVPAPEPIAAANATQPIEQESSEPAETDGASMAKRILTIDDSKTMRDMLMLTLAEAGFEVLQAVDGQHGLDVLGDDRVDVVITDINMPIMDGYGVIRNLRKNPVHKTTPILVLTTESDSAKKVIAREAGATGWMVKPFDPDRLIATIRKVAP
jgi:two-component system chemotaxis response regulator CheY